MTDRPIYYFARFVPGYRRPILEQLNKRLNGRLIVCAGQPPRASSIGYLISADDKAFKSVTLKNWWLRGDKVHAQLFRKVFREFGDPDAILAEESPRSITLPFLLRYARSCGAGRALWGHFSSLNRPFDPTKNVQDRYRLALARHVEACACYTPGVADMLRPFLPDEKLFVARNTIDLGPMFWQHDVLAEEGKDSVRKRLSIPKDAPVLIYLGRLIPEKGTSMLLDTFARLRKDTAAVLLIIGDGPERQSMESRIAAEGLDGIRFLGPLSDDDAAPYLFASDIMLMPGYLGLVINHAFAFGLPVVSLRSPAGITAHSPEVEYVRSGENGLLVGGRTAGALFGGVQSVLADHPRYSANASAYARKHLTVDRMVEGLHGAIQHAASSANR